MVILRRKKQIAGLVLGLSLLASLRLLGLKTERLDPDDTTKVINETQRQSLQDTGTVEALPGDPQKTQIDEALRKQIDFASGVIPRVTALRSRPPEDLHHAPEGVVEAGAAIGDLLEYLARHPEHFKEASRFFSECAADADVLPAIRALCLHSIQDKPDQWAPGVKERIEGIPPSILELESEL
jgi:hypothetical protein